MGTVIDQDITIFHQEGDWYFIECMIAGQKARGYVAKGNNVSVDAEPSENQLVGVESVVWAAYAFTGPDNSCKFAVSINFNETVLVLGDGKVFYAFYPHMKDAAAIAVGTVVTAGDPIAKYGGAGNSTGEHMHLGIYTGSPSDNQFGYHADKPFDDNEDGYIDYRGARFFDAQEVVRTQGQIILDNYKA